MSVVVFVFNTDEAFIISLPLALIHTSQSSAQFSTLRPLCSLSMDYFHYTHPHSNEPSIVPLFMYVQLSAGRTDRPTGSQKKSEVNPKMKTAYMGMEDVIAILVGSFFSILHFLTGMPCSHQKTTTPSVSSLCCYILCPIHLFVYITPKGLQRKVRRDKMLSIPTPCKSNQPNPTDPQMQFTEFADGK